MSNQIIKRLSAIPFILGGLFIISQGVELGILRCNRLESSSVHCQLIYSNLWDENITSIMTEQFQGAEVQKKKRSYRIVLLTQRDKIPLIHSYTMGKQRKVKKVNQINDFFHSSEQKSLTIKQDHHLFSYFFGFIFILSGIIAIFFPELAGIR